MCKRFRMTMSLCISVLMLPLVACAGAILNVEPLHVEMGDIQQGDKIEQVITLQNTGNSPLNIDQVKTSCGCTATLLSKKTILAGERGELKVFFDSSNFSGHVEKTVYIHTNDEKSRVVEVSMTGNVVPQIGIVPSLVNFGRLQPNQKKELQLEITNNGTTPIVLARIEVQVRGVEANLARQELAAGAKLVVPVKVLVSAGERPNGYLLLHLEQARTALVRIPVLASVAD